MSKHPSSHENSDLSEHEIDAQLTAFVLGELPEADRVAWERKVAESADLQQEARAIREAASLVFAALQSEPTPKLTDQQRARIMELARQRGRKPTHQTDSRPVVIEASPGEKAVDPRWALIATAAVLTACLLLIVTAATVPLGPQSVDRETTVAFTDSRELAIDALAIPQIALAMREADGATNFGLMETLDGDVVIGHFVYYKALESDFDNASNQGVTFIDANGDGTADQVVSFTLEDLSRTEWEAEVDYEQLGENWYEHDRLSRIEDLTGELAERPQLNFRGTTPLVRMQGVDPSSLATSTDGLDVFWESQNTNGRFDGEQRSYFDSGVAETRYRRRFAAPSAGSTPVPMDRFGRGITPLSSYVAQPDQYDLYLESAPTTYPYYAMPSGGFSDLPLDVRQLNESLLGAQDFGDQSGNGQSGQGEQMPDFYNSAFRFQLHDLEQGQAGGMGGGGLPHGYSYVAEDLSQLGLLPSVQYMSDDVQFLGRREDLELRVDRIYSLMERGVRGRPEAYEEAEAIALRELQSGGRSIGGRGGRPSLGWSSQELSWDDGTWALDFGTNTESYAPIVENPFKSPMEEPLATLGIDVDTASYSNVRRFIEGGQWPPADAVRIEELLNSFTYDYPQPEGNDPFSVTMEVAACPWEPTHRLMRVGMQARDIDLDARPATSLVFLIDVSGSMSDADKLPLVQESLKLLLDQMTENDRLAIVTYRDNAQVALQSITGDRRDEAIAVIDSLTAEGSTNGEGGLELAYEVATTNFIREGQNRVILCTDGDFNVGESSDDAMVQLIEQKRDTGVFLSIFGFGEGNLQDSKLEAIADHGNGQYAYIDGIRQARRKLLDELTGTLYTVAKDVKLQVEFNPLLVRGYRLIGYENRVLAAEDFNNDRVDAGDIGAGHTVTALFEIVPGSAIGEIQPSVDPLRYQRVDEVEFEVPSERTPERARTEDGLEPVTFPRFYRLSVLEEDATIDTLSELMGKSIVHIELQDSGEIEIDTTRESHNQVMEFLNQLGEEPIVSVAWQVDHLEQVVVPADVQHELCVVKVRYKQPTADESVRLDFPVDDRDHRMTAPTRDFHWATAVAGYGMLVRNSPHRGDISWGAVIEIAQGAQGDDVDGRRAEFVTLAQQTRDLWYRQHGIDNTPQPVSLDSTTARERATCGGKYSNLLDKLEVPDDFETYGNFRDFGWWEGTEYKEHTGLPHAHWVYVYPHWYLWGEMNDDVSATTSPAHPLNENGLVADDGGVVDAPVADEPASAVELPDIYFAENDVSPETIQIMAGGHYGTVTLAGARFDGAIVEGLRHVGSIETLRLFGEGLSGQIPRLEHVSGLTGLELGTPLRLMDLEAIGELSNLTHLKLPQDLAITVTGARNIAKLTGLTSLDLYNCQIDDASIAELVTLTQLEQLDLTYTQVSDAGLVALSAMPHLKSLILNRNWMTQTRITDASVATLVELKELETLSLWGTDISDEGLSQLATLPNLKSLSIGQTQITGDGLAALESSVIESLTLSPNQVGVVFQADPMLQQLTQPMLQEIYQRELNQIFPASEQPEPEEQQPGESDQSGSGEEGNSQQGGAPGSCDDPAGSGEEGQPQDDGSSTPEVTGDGPQRGTVFSGRELSHIDERWFVRFDHDNIDEYAKQLDYFGIELGVLLDEKMVVMSGMSSTPVTREVAVEEGESQPHFVFRPPAIMEFDRTLFERAGIDASEGAIHYSLPEETEAKFAEMERGYADRTPEQIRRTYFTIEADGEGYTARVIRQVPQPQSPQPGEDVDLEGRESPGSCDDSGDPSSEGQPLEETQQPGEQSEPGASDQVNAKLIEANLSAQMPGLMHLKRMPNLKSVLVIGQFDSMASITLWQAMAPSIQWGFIDP